MGGYPAALARLGYPAAAGCSLRRTWSTPGPSRLGAPAYDVPPCIWVFLSGLGENGIFSIRAAVKRALTTVFAGLSSHYSFGLSALSRMFEGILAVASVRSW